MIKKFDGEYRFLSNFYPVSLSFEGRCFPSSEHAYQAAKTLNPGQKMLIQAASGPGMAKRLGSKVDLRKDWEQVKDRIMKEILLEKFRNKSLEGKLLGTGTEILVEGNTWHDNYWGSCICARCGDRGRNKLGKILMDLRTFYQACRTAAGIDS